MSDLYPARRKPARLTRADRDALRSVDAISTHTALELRRVRAAEDIECAKVEAIGTVAAVGLVEISNLSSLELALFQRTPHAGARLQLVADAASTGIAGIVTKLDRRLR